MKKKLAIGVSDFKKLRVLDTYYVDKTLYIKDIIENTSEVLLVTRPRRFGKTLNMSMLYYYFDITKKSEELFKDLKIMKEEKKYTEQLNSTPVIYITLKDINRDNLKQDMLALESVMMDLYQQYIFLMDTDLLFEGEKKIYKDILMARANENDLINALKKLCEYITRYYKIAPYLLIDEYDVPLQYAYSYGYYEEAIKFFKSFFGASFKDNQFFKKVVLTGVSRIAKESIFSGVNNFKVCTILDEEFADDFGITKEEMKIVVKDFEIENESEEIAKWYDGYIIGKDTHIYNPWSIINYLDEKKFKSYWANTSSNDIIEMIVTKSLSLKPQLEDLLKGKDIEVSINEETILPGIEQSESNIWGLMLQTGYLKVTEKLEENRVKVAIVNYEVKRIFEILIERWFYNKLPGTSIAKMLENLIKGNIEEFELTFKRLVETTFSYYDVGIDTAENFYHAFVLGMLVNLKDVYYIRSNRESGMGRYDIMLEPIEDKESKAIIMEFKVYNESYEKDLDVTIARALKQIEEKGYETELKERGYNNIMKVAFAFNGKNVKIKVVE